MKLKMTILFIMFSSTLFAQEVKKELTITKKYLNIPVEHTQERQRMTIKLPGTDDRSFMIRLSDGNPDYWVFSDVSAFIGRTIEIEKSGRRYFNIKIKVKLLDGTDFSLK